MNNKLVTTSLSLRRDALIWSLRRNNGNNVLRNTAHKYLGDWAIAIRAQSTRRAMHQQMTRVWHYTETYSNGIRDSGE